MGFNNGGYEAARARLARTPVAGVVGVNFGPNKDAAETALADYVAGAERRCAVRGLFHDQHFLAQHAGPARPAARDALDELVGRARRGARGATAEPRRRPLLIKIAPDLDLRDARRRVAGRARARRRRPHRLQHDDCAAADARLRVRSAGSRRPFGPAAVRAFDPDARARLSRCGGALPLIGVRRLETRRRRSRRSRPARRSCRSTRASSIAARADRRDPGGPDERRVARLDGVADLVGVRRPRIGACVKRVAKKPAPRLFAIRASSGKTSPL